jgi:magnesium transporter
MAIHIYGSFGGGNKTDLRIDLALVRPLLREEGTVIWIDLEFPTDEEIERVGKVMGFHPLAIEDATKYVELPKIDEFEDHAFLVTHGMRITDEGEVEKVEIDCFIGKNYLVTSHQRESRSLAAVREHVRRAPELLARGPDFLLHEVLDRQVDNYLPLLDGFDIELDRLEEEVLERFRPDILQDILKLRRQVIALRRSIGPQRDVIGRLARHDLPYISTKATIYFRDVYDHVVRTHEMLEGYRDLVAAVMESHRSMAAQRLNEVMQRLTAISTVFLPITFIAGVFGMNFRHMPELEWRWGYPAALGFMFAVGVGMYVFFRRKNWV